MRLRALAAILALPFTAAIVVPGALLLSYHATLAPEGPPTPLRFALALVGLALGAGGVAMLAATIALFAGRGQGTLAPWDPPRRLVVAGPYRHVRNPMITGVLALLLGEVLLTLSAALAVWFAANVVANALYIPLLEEPGLERRFGADYRRYRENVPRWVPRLAPWRLPPETRDEG